MNRSVFLKFSSISKGEKLSHYIPLNKIKKITVNEDKDSIYFYTTNNSKFQLLGMEKSTITQYLTRELNSGKTVIELD